MAGKIHRIVLKLVALAVLSLSFSACGVQEAETPAADDARIPPDMEEPAAAGGYSSLNMYFSAPQFSQVIVNCADGVRTAPASDAPAASHGLSNEYAEVVAQCEAVTTNSGGQLLVEDWLLIRFEVVTAPESNIGWVPLSSAAEYTAANCSTVSFPLRLKSGAVFYNSGGGEDTSIDMGSVFSVDGTADDGMLNVSGVGGWTAKVYAADILYPAVGDAAWFD